MRPVLIIVCTLAACSSFPELDSRTTGAAMNAPYPSLLPREALVAGQPSNTSLMTGPVEARAAALRRRAAYLRGRQIIDRTTRARLQAAIGRHSR